MAGCWKPFLVVLSRLHSQVVPEQVAPRVSGSPRVAARRKEEDIRIRDRGATVRTARTAKTIQHNNIMTAP